ncbi:hypothetical protein HNR46_002749 [Haloferula luteola]|uniref:Uncharacterized protein n=1 Tax=Haloferula luteola TaxID=595692 RepID=A0A840V4L8_9BACT|nr:hypothetical protein [Haloferula luteola]MBB5352503.1 hypothetical protein [Haloferula luteola]
MKTMLVKTGWSWVVGAVLALASATAQSIGDGLAVLPFDQLGQEVPEFYSVEAETSVALDDRRAVETVHLRVEVLQGWPEAIEVGLEGEGQVLEVTGAGLASWSVRVDADGQRFLDLTPELPVEKPVPWRVGAPWNFEVTAMVEHDFERGEEFSLTLPGPGKAVGFLSRVDLHPTEGQRIKVLEVSGLNPVEEEKLSFEGSGRPRLKVSVAPQGWEPRGIELIEPELVGRSEAEGLSWVLRGRVRVSEPGSETMLLAHGALSGRTSGANWHVSVVKRGEDWVNVLVGDVVGESEIELSFEVPKRVEGEWSKAAFLLPAGTIVPVRLEGVDGGVVFDDQSPWVPVWREGAWQGFLNAEGEAELAWKDGGEDKEEVLLYVSNEATSVEVGAGMLRQLSELSFRVLQGSLPALEMGITGEGEVVAVEGEQVLAWEVVAGPDGRRLKVSLSQAVEGESRLQVRSQQALGAFPLEVGPLFWKPVGSLRHRGYLRVVPEGSVRVEVRNLEGMMQVSPELFPDMPQENSEASSHRSASSSAGWVYRFPSVEHDCRIGADRVVPEVGVTEVTVHEMGASDRRMVSRMELDIREAPVREWVVGVPAGFAVSAVEGAEVADFALGHEDAAGVRWLKVFLKEAVMGRQLISLNLEKNQAAEAGAWTLPRWIFPGAKSIRGWVGVSSAPGYRVVMGESEGLMEAPVDFFPGSKVGLQQAFRIREEDWSATMQVEALGRSVQADAFHLYSLKEGVAYGSVVVNYFVVGAPATEWRLRMPEGIGNVAVTGQAVGRDWRQEGNELVVPLVRPTLGGSTILVTFEQPMGARGGELRPGELRPLGVQAERGYVQVTSPLQMKLEGVRSQGSVLKVDPSELPIEYRLLSDAPTLGAWQYTAGDGDLAVQVELFESDEMAGEMVDFVALESHVSRDGQVATQARIFVRAKAATNLEVGLPDGAGLWEARVAGERVNARLAKGVILVPLPAMKDPNDPVEVTLRYGQTLGKGTMELVAPRMGAATAVTEWKIQGDPGRRLLPKGGTAEWVRPVRTETGFEWIATHGRMWAAWVLFLAALGVVLRQIRPVAGLGWMAWLGAAGWAIHLAVNAWQERRPNLATLECRSPAIMDGGELSVRLENVGRWAAWIEPMGLLIMIIGLAAWVGLAWKCKGRGVGVAVAVMVMGLLAQPGGAVVFFAMLALALMIMVGRGFWQKGVWGRRMAKGAVAALGMLWVVSPRVEANGVAEAVEQEWSLDGSRLTGEVRVRVRAEEEGERFVLLKAPAVLTNFEGQGLRVVKEAGVYYGVADSVGGWEGRARFELNIADPKAGWMMPTGPAVVEQVVATTVTPGWEFCADRAVSVSQEGDIARLHLMPGGGARIWVRPQQRDVSQEEMRFFSEMSQVYVPGPGGVNGLHRLGVRPAQGRVRTLQLEIPEGFTVGEVRDGPVGRWRFDPGTRELEITLEPAQETPFSVVVETQRSMGRLPLDLELAPVRVTGAAGEMGMLGLAFGAEAQPANERGVGMSEVGLDDFEGSWLLEASGGEAVPVLQKVYRYGEEEARVQLRVEPVAAEIRAVWKETLSLGDDRVVMAADLEVKLARAGVFQLEVELPEGLEVEAVSGESLSHWMESRVEGRRGLVLYFRERTLGRQTFSLSLSGPSPSGEEEWMVPRLAVRGATRQSGALTVVPERGLQVRAVSREQVSQSDPGETGAAAPGALVFRLLQGDWSLALEVKRLAPWVTAQVLHRVTLREGQSLTRVRMVYRIENSARKALRVKIPGLDERTAATVRASGPWVADFVPMVDEEGVWELRFQRAVAGETEVNIEFERGESTELREVMVLEPEEVRQLSYFVAVGTLGRMAAEEPEAVRGWRKSDFSMIPSALGSKVGGDRPEWVYRVAESEGPLEVKVNRQELAPSERLRVREGHLVTLLSGEGDSITTVVLTMDAQAESTLSLSLPDGASPLSLQVNGEGVPLVRNGPSWRFYVRPSSLPDQPTEVRFAYGVSDQTGSVLEAPTLSVPLENLTWDVRVPRGWQLTQSRGDFEWVDEGDGGDTGLGPYLAAMAERRKTGKVMAAAELDQGYAWLHAGRQDKAGEALGKAARNLALDEASNEDARVQFRNLKVQQALLGLQTRRQRMYLDNRFNGGDVPNAQMEQAVEVNPVLQGETNFDPESFDRLMVGNSVEVNHSLSEIAGCIVDQQIQVEGGRTALDVGLPSFGKTWRFTRSLQVEGDRPMALVLKFDRERPRGWVWGGIVGVLAVGVLGIGWRVRP